jgi:hypothetical protein
MYSIDVNARSSNCFEIEQFRRRSNGELTPVGEATGVRARLNFLRAHVRGPVAINGISIPIPGAFKSSYDEYSGNIDLGLARDLGFTFRGRKVSLGKVAVTQVTGPNMKVADVTVGNMGKVGGLDLGARGRLDFIAPGRSRLRVNVRLPDVFSMGDGLPAEARVELFADNTHPFTLDNAHISLPAVLLGPILVEDFNLDYQAQGERWEGGALLKLYGTQDSPALDARPPPLGKGGPAAGIGFANGGLSHAGADLNFGSLSPQIFPGVFLSHIRFSLGTHPLVMSGGVTLSTAKIVNVRGDLLAMFATPDEPYTVPAGLNPALDRLRGRTFYDLALAGGGDVYFSNIPQLSLGSAYLLYAYPNMFEFGGGVDVPLGVFSVRGEASGFFDSRTRRFNVEGNGEFCAAGIGCYLRAAMLASSDGIAACVGITFVDVGAGYRWGDGIHLYFYGCDVGDYRVRASSARAAANGVTVRAGLPFVALEVKGAGDAPAVTVRGPKGESFSTANGRSQIGPAFSFVRSAENATTYLSIKSPSAGNWALTAEPGSTIANVSMADGMPKPKITGRVSGRGAARTLRYRLDTQPGQQVTFAEQGTNLYHELGKVTKASGQLRFSPAFSSRPGTRKIVAIVSRGGMARQKVDVTTFRFARPAKPARPNRVRVRRRKTQVTVTWGASAGAVRYAVTMTLADGTRRLVLTRRRRAVFRGVDVLEAGVIRVTGLRADNVAGRARRAAFKRG